MKFEKTSQTIKREGQVTFAQLCEALEIPISAGITLVHANGTYELTEHDVLSVSYEETPKPRKAREKREP